MINRKLLTWMGIACLLVTSQTASAAIIDGLVRHYKLDEGSAAIAAVDSTGNKDLTEDGGSGGPLPTPGATGIIGGAWDFERDNSEFLDEGDDIWAGFNDVAASMWVKPESLNSGGSNQYTIFSEDSGTLDSQSKDAVLWVTDQGAVRWSLELGEDDWNTVQTADGVITNGVWNHIAVVKSGTTASIYVNGSSPINAIVPDETVDSVNDLMLGAFEDSDASDAWDGLMDDVGFWNRALTSGEVSTIYNEGLLGVDLSNAVPEPSTYLLTLLSCVAAWSVRTSRK